MVEKVHLLKGITVRDIGAARENNNKTTIIKAGLDVIIARYC